jgi:hypothetical protein
MHGNDSRRRLTDADNDLSRREFRKPFVVPELKVERAARSDLIGRRGTGACSTLASKH